MSDIGISDYQRLAQGSAVYPESRAIEYLVLGLASEAGEVAGKYKKIIRDKYGLMDADSKAALADEIGDVLWYLAMLSMELGFSLDQIAGANIAKLGDRMSRGAIRGDGDKR